MKVRTATLNGIKYDLFFSAEIDGSCDSPRGKPCHTIEVNVPLRTRRGIQVLIHECLHAEDWAKDEAIVTRVGEDIGDIIWRLIRSGQLK